MFGDRDFDESFEDLFKHHQHEISSTHSGVSMGIQWLAYSVGAVMVVCIVVACCCRRRRSRGQIIATAAVPPAPPAPNNQLPVGYPQQHYTAYPSVQVVATYPVAQATAAPYPAGAHYPTGSPYPAAGAPYPTGAPYPAGSPYPPAAAPYPTECGPYAAAMPYPSAPSATDTFYGVGPPPGAPPVPVPAPAPAGWSAQAMPPSYEQATGAKHPAYNPHAPH